MTGSHSPGKKGKYHVKQLFADAYGTLNKIQAILHRAVSLALILLIILLFSTSVFAQQTCTPVEIDDCARIPGGFCEQVSPTGARCVSAAILLDEEERKKDDCERNFLDFPQLASTMSSGQFPAQAIPLADFKNLLGITLDGPINVRVSRTNSQALSQDQATARAQFVKECESEQPRRAPSAYSQYQPYRYSPEQQLNSCVSRKLAAWQNENPSTVSIGVFVTGDEIIPTWSSSGSSTSRHNTVAQSSYDSLVQSQRFPELGRTPVADIAIPDS